MTCKIVRNTDGQVIGIICSAPWGIGTYRIPYESRDSRDAWGSDIGYGYFQPKNLHDFWPDEEMCTPAEIAAHKEACDAWDAQ
jgi:hypothetical protein